jgi:TonB family protein
MSSKGRANFMRASFFLMSLFLHAIWLLPLSWPLPQPGGTHQVAIDLADSHSGSSARPSSPRRERQKGKATTVPNLAPAHLLGESSPSNIESTPTTDGTTDVLGEDLGVHPRYPRLSRILGEVGTVKIIFPKLNSEPQQVRVAQSSGYARLDNAALEASRKALAEGLFATHAWAGDTIRVTFVFRLTP